MTDWIKPGAEVIRIRGPVHTSDTINKVHKNGNFTVHGGGPQQFRPHGDQATATGGSSWSSITVKIVPATPENVTAMMTARTLANAKRTIEREIERLRRITGNDGIL